MRFSVALVAALSAGVASAGWMPQSSYDDLDPVPGESPLKYCDKDRADDIVTITKVDLSPNPPQTGADLVINAIGTVSERIAKGAYVQITVKYGLIRLVNKEFDLCDQIQNVDLACPVEKGVLSITKTVQIPREVPPGTYDVTADVFNYDDEHITCLKANVAFGGKRAFSDEI